MRFTIIGTRNAFRRSSISKHYVSGFGTMVLGRRIGRGAALLIVKSACVTGSAKIIGQDSLVVRYGDRNLFTG